MWSIDLKYLNLISKNHLEYSMTGAFRTPGVQGPRDAASTIQLAFQPFIYYIRLQGIPHINNIDTQQIQLVY